MELHRMLFRTDLNIIPGYTTRMMTRYFLLRLANRLTLKLQNGIPSEGIKITLKHEEACAMLIFLRNLENAELENSPLNMAVVIALIMSIEPFIPYS
jgi:hypothetical protein